MIKHLRIALICILALTIILSCTVVGSKLTDPATYSHTIEVLDQNRSTILGLTAASAAASAAISAIPDDICTPLAEEISELTTWFAVILAVVYLEKYLLTILGAAACYILFPVGCAALLIHCFFPQSVLKSLGTKLVVFGAALLLVIPSSVWVSDHINTVYSRSIETTIESATAVSDNLFEEMSGSNGEDSTVIDEAKSLLDDVSGSVAAVIEQFKNVLNRFIEAVAVLVVTTCLIPLLVILFFAWGVKTLFDVRVILPPPPSPRRRRNRKDRDEEDFLFDE
ncbi:MAG: hypothetical protein E7442_08800 [Ruminococcaceae bacterium]|nr:hypothetical protein [Oscillospiraceae bacterium]